MRTNITFYCNVPIYSDFRNGVFDHATLNNDNSMNVFDEKKTFMINNEDMKFYFAWICHEILFQGKSPLCIWCFYMWVHILIICHNSFYSGFCIYICLFIGKHKLRFWKGIWKNYFLYFYFFLFIYVIINYYILRGVWRL